MKKEKLPSWLPHLSFGDVIDQLSIVARKVFFGEEDAIEELNYLIEHLDKMKIDKSVKRTGKFIVTIIRLAQVNFEVWERENKFRQGESMPAQKVKQMMIEVREFNTKRKKYRNELNRLTQWGFREFKVKHRSQC